MSECLLRRYFLAAIINKVGCTGFFDCCNIGSYYAKSHYIRRISTEVTGVVQQFAILVLPNYSMISVFA